MLKRSEAIKNFLTKMTHPDLAEMYHAGMECQVIVAKDHGERVTKSFKGRPYQAYTDGDVTWKPFRIPMKANSKPEDNDGPMSFDLMDHAEGIGMTGWDWKELKSYYFGYDFDAIVGHSEKHKAKLSEAELKEVENAARQEDWITIRKSTSGNGLHLYVNVPGIPTSTHTEHAALARAILGKMSSIIGFDFQSKIDACGGNMWVWARKMKGDGLSIVKQGRILELTEIPPNWKDHLKAVQGISKKAYLKGVRNPESIEDLSNQRYKLKLDDDHKRLIKFLHKEKALYSWYQDHHMLITHSWWLQKAHKELELKGIFVTDTPGSDLHTQNCFAFPLRHGAWAVRRYSKGIQEHQSWDQDGAGWTRCYLNRAPELDTSSTTYNGVELEKGGFEFDEGKDAVEAIKSLGLQLDIPEYMQRRKTIIKPHKDGRLILKIQYDISDAKTDMAKWTSDGKHWTRIISPPVAPASEPDVANFDDVIRHIVSLSKQDAGWMLKTEDRWHQEPLTHIRLSLKALGVANKEIDIVTGASTLKPWVIVNKPFEGEYPGDREWNHDAAQLRFPPTDSDEALNFPTWSMILDHCGTGLNNEISQNVWCKANGILNGADYLKCWISSLFQFPGEPLPWIFFYGPQNSGKSIFHEALDLLLIRGYMRADTAITSPSSFNEELKNAVLCVVEETNLRKHAQAYNRIKDWTNSRKIPIHGKGKTPYLINNTMHWIQCANDHTHCPIFSGDTRVTMIYVPPLDPLQLIPKKRLIPLLEKEAPNFLAEILSVELPESNDRFNIPVIRTYDKEITEKLSQTALESFIDAECVSEQGCLIKFSLFYEKFLHWVEPDELAKWSKIKVGRQLPPQFPKARRHSDGHYYIGNIWWRDQTPEPIAETRLVVNKSYLEPANA